MNGGLAASEQLHGKALSYNNLMDADAAWRLVLELPTTGAAIIKHSNPCGVAVAGSLEIAYQKALDCDRTSAFGGIVALNSPCDAATAQGIAEIFTEVVIAPAFDEAALEILRAKKNLRLLRAPVDLPAEPDLRKVSGGLLVQSSDPRTRRPRRRSSRPRSLQSSSCATCASRGSSPSTSNRTR